jgi:cytoplasmic iron level regulating protein YaaA (DUF328/UPF0246 family)
MTARTNHRKVTEQISYFSDHVFRPKRDEIIGSWTKRHNEELHNSYSSPNTIRILKSMRWARLVARKGEKRNAYRVFEGKSGGTILPGRPRRR